MTFFVIEGTTGGVEPVKLKNSKRSLLLTEGIIGSIKIHFHCRWVKIKFLFPYLTKCLDFSGSHRTPYRSRLKHSRNYCSSV